MDMDAMGRAIGIAAFLALVCTVLSMIFITPEKRRAKLKGFFGTLADIFNFKGLLVEQILKAFYIFLTLLSVFGGLFMCFTGEEGAPAAGLMFMLIMPIVLRVVFEFFMLAIVQTKNIIQINNKLPDMTGRNVAKTAPAPAAKPAAPAAPKGEEPKLVFCGQCGAQYDSTKGGCPKCKQ